VKVELDQRYLDPYSKDVTTWSVMVPIGSTCTGFENDAWKSIGPHILNTKSTGRMYRVAQHPNNADILYVTSLGGGLWKSVNGGDHWDALWDGMKSMGAFAVALDPNDPDIVYAGTYDAHGTVHDGIYKSLDAGTTWKQFAPPPVFRTGISELHVRYVSGELVVYAQSAKGLHRYKSKDPKAQNSTAGDWKLIFPGELTDFAVHPSDPNKVYVAVLEFSASLKKNILKGIYYTSQGAGTSVPTWTKYLKGLEEERKNAVGTVRIDINKKAPTILYFASNRSNVTYIYSSNNSGSSWASETKVARGYSTAYNDYIRIHPENSRVVYIGGVKLFKVEKIGSSWQYKRIANNGLHDDQKTLEFDQKDNDTYYVTNDGGVWECQVRKPSGGKIAEDQCKHRNQNLITLQFYDIDASQKTADLMLGGNQDNGTVRWTNRSPTWTEVIGGDGNYVLIAPSDDKIMYQQYQSLGDMRQSIKGGDPGTWPRFQHIGLKGKGTNNFIASHPGKPHYVLAPGNEVYLADFSKRKKISNDGPTYSVQWVEKVVKSKTRKQKGGITRVIVNPKTSTWFAGTGLGEVWYSKDEGGTWELLMERKDYATVISFAFAPTNPWVLFVAYRNGSLDKRVQRVELKTDGTVGKVTDLKGFPANRAVIAVSGDGHNSELVYVATQKGVYMWTKSNNQWVGFNNCLPLTRITDLLVDMGTKERFLRAATYGRGAWYVDTKP
jgi:hypothetical protein